MRQELVDDDPTLRVGDEVDLAAGLLALHRAELLRESSGVDSRSDRACRPRCTRRRRRRTRSSGPRPRRRGTRAPSTSSATVGPRSHAVPALLIPATTITRCADPPVPSASDASSLQSAVTVSAKRRPMATTSSASIPAGVRARARRQLRRQRAHGGHGRRAPSCAAPAERRGPRGRWWRRGIADRRRPPRRRGRRPTSPRSQAASMASPTQRDAGVARVVGAVAPRSTSPPGVGRCSDDCNARRSPAGRPRGLGGVVRGHEVHELGEVVGAEQQHRVDVAVADAQPEVEHARRRGRSPAPPVVPDARRPGSTGWPVRTADRREERVRGAQTAGVGDGDVQRAGDRTGEADDAVVGGAHGRARRGGEVDAAVAGAVVGARRLERLAPPRRRPVAATPTVVVGRGTRGRRAPGRAR